MVILVIGLLLGLPRGIHQILLFFVFLGSEATEKHYKVEKWPQRDDFVQSVVKVKDMLLEDPQKVLLPP